LEPDEQQHQHAQHHAIPTQLRFPLGVHVVLDERQLLLPVGDN
jgi:hypothetical protein